MIRSISCALALFALACSGGDYQDGFELAYDDNGEELGQVEQGLTGKVTPTFSYGAQTGQARQQCNKTSTGQVCAVPKFKRIQLAYTAANFTSTQQVDIQSVVAGFNAALSFDYVGPVEPSAAIPASTVRMLVESGTCSGNSASNNIEAFSCVTTLSSLTNLTEGSGVVGAYQHFGGCAVKLDMADILARGADATEDQRLLRHAMGHLTAVCTGLGSINTSAANSFVTRQTLALGTSLQVQPTPGQICMADAYSDLSDLTNYDLITPACSAD